MSAEATGFHPSLSPTLSQAPVGGGEDEVVEETTFKPRRQVATIIYMGLAGAVLGLSTLSFYGRPQDRLTNIAVGFGAGVVIGAVYMTYTAATNPVEAFGSQIEMEESRRLSMNQNLIGTGSLAPRWNMRWDF